MTYFTHNAAKIWYDDCGDKGHPAVVLLHAASGCSRHWAYQNRFFVMKNFRVVTYDRRGYGRTEVLDPNRPYSDDGDLIALIEHLEIEDVSLIGMAAGAFVALKSALLLSDQVSHLVLSTTLCGIKNDAYCTALQDLNLAEVNKMHASMRELSPGFRVANPDSAKAWTDLHESSRSAGFKKLPKSVPYHFSSAALRSFGGKVLLIAGGADLISPPALMELLIPHFQKVDFKVLPDTGHAAFWEQPENWNKSILGFLMDK